MRTHLDSRSDDEEVIASPEAVSPGHGLLFIYVPLL
jgi:hypothetical protein